jgi:hypothetical protein
MQALAGSAYQTRPVRFLGLWNPDGWRVKVYGIAADGERPEPGLVAAAKAVVRERLPQPADGEGRYGVGFLTVHDGRQGSWVLLDWWANGNQLYHHVFGGDRVTPTDLRPVSGGLTACTWELAVTGFERQAWLEHVFAAREPDLNRYLAAQFEAEV